jgi:transposase
MLPAERGRKSRPAKPNRPMVNGILWILRSGAPWRDLPGYYGPWKSVYTRFRRWTRQGVWGRVFAELAKGADGVAYHIDATIVRVHQDGQGARKGGTNQLGARVAERPQRFTLSSTPLDALSD